MKFQKAIDLWADNNIEKIQSGRLVIQPGQWVYCGRHDHKSRYVSHTARSMNVVHWQGSGTATLKHFMARINAPRAAEQRLAARRAAA